MIIHPANCYKNDIVYFNSFDITNKGTLIEVGTKAKFINWIHDNDKNQDFGFAGIELENGEICCTSSDVLEILEQ